MPKVKETLELQKFVNVAFPALAVLVTVKDAKRNTNGTGNETNIITIAWHTQISRNPPLIGISVAPQRYSHDLIVDAGEFVVNFMPLKLSEQVHYCGSHSGRDVAKFSECGLTPLEPQVLSTHGIEEGLAHFECRIFDTKTLGDHTWFVGEVVSVRAVPGFLQDGILAKDKPPLFYIGKNTYSTLSMEQKLHLS